MTAEVDTAYLRVSQQICQIGVDMRDVVEVGEAPRPVFIMAKDACYPGIRRRQAASGHGEGRLAADRIDHPLRGNGTGADDPPSQRFFGKRMAL
jgi:hypothetical protein